MNTYGELLSQIRDKVSHDKGFDRLANIHYASICKDHSWHLLRRGPLEIDFSTMSGTGGMWLPENLAGFDMVRDNSSKEEYVRRDKAYIEAEENQLRYETFAGATAPVFEADDLVLSSNATTCQSATLSTDYTGNFIRFGDEPGFYEITAFSAPTITFKPEYRGPSMDAGGHIVIRPVSTEMIRCYDASEAVITSATIDIYYWVYPTPLYKPYDLILLPSMRPLELRMYRELPETKERRPVSEREIESAINEAVMINPDFPRKAVPRDRYNRAFTAGRGLFATRD